MAVEPTNLSIVRYPHDVLRSRAAPIETIDDTVRAVAARMLELMHEAAGVGLAGPQVGFAWRLFVTHAPDLDPQDRVFINPKLMLARDELIAAEEGCLSIPGITVQVRRPERAEISATDLDGQRFTLSGEGLLARIWQHENDHLDGVLILDRMGPMDRLANRRAIKELQADARA